MTFLKNIDRPLNGVGVPVLPVMFFFVSLIISFAAWHASLFHLLNIWWTVDMFNHGIFVPFFVAYIIYDRVSRAQNLAYNTDWSGLVSVVGICLIWWIGRSAEAKFLEHVALLMLPAGFAQLYLGRHYFSRVQVPLLFLLVGLPVGQELVEPLQFLTADVVIFLLDIFGLVIAQDGVLIELSSGLYEVAEACAGIKFLMTSSITAFFLSLILYDKASHRFALILFGLFLPVAANILRVFTILIIAEMTDQSFAKDIDHIVYGWGFLSVVLIFLIAVAFAFAPKKNTGHSDFEPGRFLRIFLNRISFPAKSKTSAGVALLFATILPIVSFALVPGFAPPACLVNEVTFFECKDCDYRKIADRTIDLKQSWPSATRVSRQLYRRGGDRVLVTVSLYTAQDAQSGYIYDTKHRRRTGWKTVAGQVKLKNRSNTGKIIESEQKLGQKQRLVWDVIWTDGHFISTPFDFKMRRSFALMLRRPAEGGIVRMVAPIVDHRHDAQNSLEEFMTQIGKDLVGQAQMTLSREEALCVA